MISCSQVTDERGQKALQREQVRRDCAELEQKLEALAQQQPQLLPSDVSYILFLPCSLNQF